MNTGVAKVKIAIIGTGISGLGAAYLLHPHHEITLYEANDYIGGHSRTVEVDTGTESVAVDTGFIVFNHRNYPQLKGLFHHLGVPVEKSDMSFGVSIRNGWLEYGTRRLFHLFAQKRNLFRPAYWQMLRDILRFNREAKRYLEAEPSVTMQQCLDELGMGEWFRRYYLLAMGGAIWSCPPEQMLTFPAATFIRFFDNHGLLTVSDQPQWHTVSGGSREYVKRLTAPFADRIRLSSPVSKVTRQMGGVTVHDHAGETENYDQVIFACHADETLAMLDNPSEQEQTILGAFRYQPNRVVLHSDKSFMPHRRQSWASWVYLAEETEDRSSAISLSYWMNNLQNLPRKTPIIATLNPAREPKAVTLHDEVTFSHPVFDAGAIAAQAQLPSLQGQHNSWFCGAYHRYGFHEDGLMSGIEVATRLGGQVPWQ